MERNAWALADLLCGLKAPDGRDIEVVIGLVADAPYDWAALEAQARVSGLPIGVRPIRWIRRGAASAANLAPEASIPTGLFSTVSIPSDGLYDLRDCDAWIVFSNTLEGYVPALRPTAVYCADHIHRYVPLPYGMLSPTLVETNDSTMLYWRQSRCVISTTPGTVADTVSFGGVQAAKVMLAPTLVDPVLGLSSAEPRSPGDYILWVTNTSPHKNHTKALEALKLYWTKLGGDLDVIICGSQVENLKPGSGAKHALTQGLEKGVGWAHRVRIAGHVDDEAFFDLVAGSAFIWHNVIIDNGTFVAFDAARAGRHVVSSDYPSMRYLAERYGIDAAWFAASDPAAAAQALIEAERKVRAGRVPQHRLQSDNPLERAAAYQQMVDRLLAP